jgi:hypothetical protein
VDVEACFQRPDGQPFPAGCIADRGEQFGLVGLPVDVPGREWLDRFSPSPGGLGQSDQRVFEGFSGSARDDGQPVGFDRRVVARRVAEEAP